MGEVYKARDTRLGRTVAIKVLPDAVATDAQSRARFEREARAISQLTHPHICTLYDVGHHDGADYIVMEFLEGESLWARLQRAGSGLPLAEALRIAGEIASALDAAHRAGIVHRDLKPGNVVLTQAGAKLLDFGLAKTEVVRTDRAAGVPTAETLALPLTAQGTILGTLQYMAPEQVEGIDADARADIWAFGAILYEMIAGRPAFAGPNAASLVASVLTQQPRSVVDVRPAAPPDVARIVDGCLEKDREKRWQHIRDVNRLLADVPAGSAAETAGGPAAVDAGPRRSARMSAIALGAAAAIAIVAAALGVAIGRRGASAPATAPLVRFAIPPPAGVRIPHFADTSQDFVPSPDGTRIVFVAGGNLWLQALDRPTPEKIEGTAGADAPFWSPDGRAIAFFAGQQLKKKTLDGGPPQTVCAMRGGGNGAWSPEGTILFSEWGERRIMRVPAEGGTPAVVRSGNAEFGWLQFLPDGRHYLYAALEFPAHEMKNVLVGVLGGDQVVTLPNIPSRAEYAAGRLVFTRDAVLLAQPFDADRLQLTGAASPIVDYVTSFSSTGYAGFATGGSRLLVYQAIRESNRLAWVDRDGRDIEPIGAPNAYSSLRLSPDGSRLAVTVRDPILGTNDIVVHDFARNIDSRLTTERGSENVPVWSPDGRTIVYAADRLGPPHLHARDASGSDERQITGPSTGIQFPTAFTPDGRSVIYADNDPETLTDLMIVAADGRGTPAPLVRTKARELGGRPSPDGKWLAYSANQSGRFEIYVRPFGDDRTRWQVSRAGGTNPKWRADGRELFYVEGNRLMSVDVSAAPTFNVGAPRALFSRPAFTDYDVAPDGRRFVFSTLDPVADAGALNAVLGWPALLSTR